MGRRGGGGGGGVRGGGRGGGGEQPGFLFRCIPSAHRGGGSFDGVVHDVRYCHSRVQLITLRQVSRNSPLPDAL